MSLYKQWTDMVVEYVKTKGEKAFWAEYTKIETAIYRDLLANHKEAIKTTIADFAKKYETTVEFIMGFVDGINDSLECAKKLVALLNKIKAKVNLIYFNPHEGSPYKRPSKEKVEAFREFLLKKGLLCTIRESKGLDISAACGQLREKEIANA